ncbi:MAG: hypothetical protein IIY55_08595 [Blautia sp.]|nr:hypothetical protein [Blautia sp.]
MLGIGIDTGGTCTDAVIYDFATKTILGSGKALTTKSNLEVGIANALDALPPSLVEKAGMIGLSTTLATNACLENKGARSKLLLIGFDMPMIEHLKDIYASYGMKDLTRFIVVDAKVEGVYANPFDPDWEDLRRKAPEYFADCDSIGIVQKHPRANGGRFELTARQILKETVTQPVTISYDISNEVDILKTCAGTMLNARLIPLVTEFMEAVRHVMEERNLHIPLSIVRSDGTIMSEDMARTYPVETILCGPSASVVGGSTLSDTPSGIIVDMGGTTTDIAIIRSHIPVLAKDGIRIGQWKTMVKGLYVETFGLGGDSAVRYKNNELYLDTVRVIPLCVLSSQYDYVLPYLRKLAEEKRFYTCQAHEFYILLKDISGKAGYTDFEQLICSWLKEKPLSTLELGERMGFNPAYLSTERLEEDGVIIKSGLTPTDMMVLKGDFTLYEKDAPAAAVESLFANIRQPLADVPDLVYEMVTRRMYDDVAQVILKQQFPKVKEFSSPEFTKTMLNCFYEQAVKSLQKNPDQAQSQSENDLMTLSGQTAAALRTSPESPETASMVLTSSLPLIGVGAPIHIFLPEVAALLHTQAVIPEYAGVANALGAVASRKSRQIMLIIKAEYEGPSFMGFSFYEDGKKYRSKDKAKMIALGKEAVLRSAAKWAKAQGIPGEPRVDITLFENRFENRPDGLLFEIQLHAVAAEA